MPGIMFVKASESRDVRRKSRIYILSLICETVTIASSCQLLPMDYRKQQNPVHTSAHKEGLQTIQPDDVSLLQAVAERMASDLADVRLGCVVNKITWGPEGVCISCTNGQSFEGDAVISTVSLGVLKVTVLPAEQ